MLKNILKELNNSNSFSVNSLSKKFNVDSELIESAIEKLINLKYIKKDKTSDSCGSFCSSCPYANSCNKDLINFYQLTEKGINYLNKDS